LLLLWPAEEDGGECSREPEDESATCPCISDDSRK
jgi:hypothetical protein